MESATKRASNWLRQLVNVLDYRLFQLLHKDKPLPEIKKIIIIERLSVGDMVSVTPVIKALNEKYPNASIDILVNPHIKDLIKSLPYLNKIYNYSDKEIKNNYKKIVKEFKKEQYDLGVIIRHGTYRLSKLLKDADVKYRIGSAKAGLLVGRGFFLHKKSKAYFGMRHVVKINMDVLETIGIKPNKIITELKVSNEIKNQINSILEHHGISKNDFVIGIHAGSKGICELKNPSHLWPPERYAFVADYLSKKYNAKIVFSGAKNENPLIKKIVSFMKTKPIIMSDLNMEQFVALLNRIDLLFSNDTAAAHISPALNTPLVVMFGPQTPELWRPWAKKIKILYHNEKCTACQRYECKKSSVECMDAISVTEVLNAIDEAMEWVK